MKATARALAKSPGVALAEPDVRMFPVPDDPNYSQQWDLGPAGPSVYGIDVEGAWAALPNPASVTVAVADTGHVDHQDLALAQNATYEWQVRADNAAGTTFADGGAWQFSTR